MYHQDFSKQNKQLLNSLLRLSEISNNINYPQTSAVIAFEKLYITLSEVAASTNSISPSLLKIIKSKCFAINNMYNSSIFKSLEQLSEACKKLSLHYQNLISSQDSSQFVEISNQIMTNLSECDLPDEVHNEISKTMDETKSNNLNIDRMIAIIGLIIVILTFVLDFLPDKQLQETNDKLQQLIEIENRQLEAIEQQQDLSKMSLD